MQVVIRMQDVDVLAEVVDAVEDVAGFVPGSEATKDEWCVARYDAEGATEVLAVVDVLLKQCEARGLMLDPFEETNPVMVQIDQG